MSDQVRLTSVSITMRPLTMLFLITTPVALTVTPPEQLIVLLSITVPFAVIVQDPV